MNSKADPDVWMKIVVKPNGFKYYEYLLCYVDDILFSSMNPEKIMREIEGTYKLKKGSVSEHVLYLGDDV